MTAQLAEQNVPQTGPKIRIYQPYLDEQQLAEVNEEAIGLDMSFNTSPSSREYELFKAIQQKETSAGVADFWGLVSRKFELKSPIPFSQFRKNAEAAMLSGADCYAFNPMIGKAAMYYNVQEHDVGGGGHPQLEPLFDLAKAMGCPVGEPQNYKTFFYCNYVVGNARFWKGYFSFCDLILARCESEGKLGTLAGKTYLGSGGYWRNLEITMRPFFIERLLGYYLHLSGKSGLKIEAYRPCAADFDLKFGKSIGPIIHALYEGKETFIESGKKSDFNTWLDARHAIAYEPNLIWILDDPPTWMPPR